MVKLSNFSLAASVTLLAAALQGAQAQVAPQATTLPIWSLRPPVYYGHWMPSDVNRAWSKGFYGQGAKVTVIDAFGSWAGTIEGDLRGTFESKSHGGWTSDQVRLIAPRAMVIEQNFAADRLSKLPFGFNVLNLSFGAPAQVNARQAYSVLNDQGKSIVDHARNGSAVVVKAAGNGSGWIDKRPVGQLDDSLNDALSLALKGSPSVIFVGALDSHGWKNNKADMAFYSNVAGSDKAFNSRFVVVGVPAYDTNLSGTSFAAPVVSAYSAILYSKFQKASPTQISNQILRTARKDTVIDYNLHIHGQGEADLSRALAPKKIQ